jgi:hypothetical protein
MHRRFHRLNVHDCVTSCVGRVSQMAQPEQRERPGVGTEALKSRLAATNSHSNARPDNSPTTRRRYWARRMIDKAHGAEIPTYGSPEWACLPEDDARWVAAVVIAAESWARAGDTLEGRPTT